MAKTPLEYIADVPNMLNTPPTFDVFVFLTVRVKKSPDLSRD